MAEPLCLQKVNSEVAAGEVQTEEDIYKRWDPLGDESRCYLNASTYDDSDPVLARRWTKPRTKADMPCKFFKPNSPRTTCRNERCPFLHDRRIAQGVIDGDYKLATPLYLEEITLLCEVCPKKEAPDGIINNGIVVSIVDPGEFYVVPYGDWVCACTRSSLRAKNESGRAECSFQENTGVSNLLDLWEDLDNMARVIQMSNSYVKNQLVAVKIDAGEPGKQWFRAVVLEDVGVGEIREIPTVHLRLLDFGTYITTTTDMLIPLPKKLLRYPQLGYRCGLYGISPITHRWNRRAVELFLFLAHGQECIFEVKRRPYPEVGYGDGIFESTPHLLEVTVKLNGKFVNCSTKLGEEGLGLLWNPFPTVPSILRNAPEERGLSLIAKHQPHCLPHNLKLMEGTAKPEKGPLEDYFKRDHPELRAIFTRLDTATTSVPRPSPVPQVRKPYAPPSWKSVVAGHGKSATTNNTNWMVNEAPALVPARFQPPVPREPSIPTNPPNPPNTTGKKKKQKWKKLEV